MRDFNLTDRQLKAITKAKTKYAIAYALDMIVPHRHYTVIVDYMTKAELLQVKEHTLQCHFTALKTI